MERLRWGARSSRGLGGLGLALVLGLAGCSWRTALWRAGVPWWTTPSKVTDVAEHDGYLEATLVSEAFQLKFLFPANTTCQNVLEPGAQVDYVQIGPLGIVTRGDTRCDPVGVASLTAWRGLHPRIPGEAPAPTAPAFFSLAYADADVALLRGRFPLVYEIAWPGGADVVAMVPNIPRCQKPIQSGAATMQFRPTGEPAFALMSSGGLCPIEGFALPESGSAPSAAEPAPTTEPSAP